jgi:hypothetical protein
MKKLYVTSVFILAGQWLPDHGWTGDPFSFIDRFDRDHSRDAASGGTLQLPLPRIITFASK